MTIHVVDQFETIEKHGKNLMQIGHGGVGLTASSEVSTTTSTTINGETTDVTVASIVISVYVARNLSEEKRG